MPSLTYALVMGDVVAFVNLRSVIRGVAAYVAFGRDTGLGGRRAGREAELPYGRGCFHLVREEVGGQRSLWPPETLGPRWRVVALPILPGFAEVERHHVHAMQLEQFNLGNHVPVPETAAALLLRVTGVDITGCLVCQQGRLRVVAVLRPGQIPAPALDTS